MKIGILVAMDKELALLLPRIENHKTEDHNGLTFHTGQLNGRDVVVSRCGIGKVNAAIGTMTLIDFFKPSVVINTGVAGGTGKTNVGDIVVADRIAYHDVWCGPDTIHGQAAGCPRHFVSMVPTSLFDGLNVSRGLIASGDIFVSTAAEVASILKYFPDAMACDMESGAIAQVCYLRSVPFMCVRVVSDTPGREDNIAQYENFWTEAPEHTFEIIDTVVSRL